MAFFDKIENRYVIEGTLHSEAGLHIGTGVAGTTTDAPFIRMNNLPYVPGSSLRGVLRSTAERLLETLWPGQQCVNFEALSTCASDSESEQVERSLAENEAVSFCDVCKFFGSTNLAARFKVSDAVLVGGGRDPVRRDGVGIDRDTETARDQIKYDFEVLEPGCNFRFTMQVENAEDSDKAILYLLLTEMKNGFDVGGKRSRGLGRVKLATDYNVSHFDQERNYPLLMYVDTGKLDPIDTMHFEAELKEAFTRYREQRTDKQ